MIRLLGVGISGVDRSSDEGQWSLIVEGKLSVGVVCCFDVLQKMRAALPGQGFVPVQKSRWELGNGYT